MKPDFADIKGHHNIKRALEIAVLGNHTVYIKPIPGHGLTMLILATEELLTRYATSEERVRIFTDESNRVISLRSSCEILLEMAKVNFDELILSKLQETSDDMLSELKAANPKADFEMSDPIKSILEKAYNKYGFTPKQVSYIKSISKTIARLDKSDVVKLEHVAEAIQYQRPNKSDE